MNFRDKIDKVEIICKILNFLASTIMNYIILKKGNDIIASKPR